MTDPWKIIGIAFINIPDKPTAADALKIKEFLAAHLKTHKEATK